MPGMLTTCDLRVIDGFDQYVVGHRSGPTKDGGGWYDDVAAGLLPDLTDPATLGCLLALVREAWGNPHIWVESCVDRQMWSSIDDYKLGWACPNGEPVPPDIECATEAEALVAALEAAP